MLKLIVCLLYLTINGWYDFYFHWGLNNFSGVGSNYFSALNGAKNTYEVSILHRTVTRMEAILSYVISGKIQNENVARLGGVGTAMTGSRACGKGRQGPA